MKGVIWYKNKEKGLQQLTDLVKEYKDIGIEADMRVTSIQASAYLSNGDIWRTYPAIEASRGIACNVSFIERCIDPNFVQRIIVSCTKGKPYRAFNYYGEAQLDKIEEVELWNISS